jgi:hypothetical protein
VARLLHFIEEREAGGFEVGRADGLHKSLWSYDHGYIMLFAKRLREGVRGGEITCSVRIWKNPHVTVGKRYAMDEGEIEVDSIEPIGLPDITPRLARESGFLGVVDLLKVAKHGKGQNIYLIRFHYVKPQKRRS